MVTPRAGTRPAREGVTSCRHRARVFVARRREDLETFAGCRHRCGKCEEIPLALHFARRLEADRVHLAKQLMVPVAVVTLARLEHVEARALFKMLDDLGRVG